MTLADWSSLIGQVGVPIAFCVAMLWGIVRVARWLSPKADDLIKVHLDMVNGVKDSVKAIEEASKRQATSVADLGTTLHGHIERVLVNHGRLLEGEARLMTAIENQTKIVADQNKVIVKIVDTQTGIKDLLIEQAKYEKRIEESHGRAEERDKRREQREGGT